MLFSLAIEVLKQWTFLIPKLEVPQKSHAGRKKRLNPDASQMMERRACLLERDFT